MDDNKISLATTRRLPLYYRCLSELNEKAKIKSLQPFWNGY